MCNMAFFSIDLCWRFGFLFQFHFLFCFIAYGCFLWGTERTGVLWGCLLLDCLTPVIQLLLQREFCLPATTLYRNLGFSGFIFRLFWIIYLTSDFLCHHTLWLQRRWMLMALADARWEWAVYCLAVMHICVLCHSLRGKGAFAEGEICLFSTYFLSDCWPTAWS